MNLEAELKKIILGDVACDEETLKTHSRDASLFEIKPEVVVFPKNSEDIKKLVRFVLENKKENPNLSLTPRAAGTDMSGGPLSDSIIVDFTRYIHHIKEINENELRATVEPGMFYRDFEKELMQYNLLFPSYPASKQLCAIGGIVANNSGGELTLRYGKTIDYVRELKVIFADGNEYVVRPLSELELEEKTSLQTFEGELYRKIYELVKEHYGLLKKAKPNVSKNSAGYNLWDVWDEEKKIFDLTKLFVGSQGTLGIITEVTLRLVKKEKYSQMIVVFLDGVSGLGNLVNAVLKYQPTTFESYDDKTLKLAVRFAPELIRRLGAKNIFTIAKNALPEFFSILFHGFPKLVLQITFNGDDAHLLRSRAVMLAKELKEFTPRYVEVIRDPQEAEEYWLIRRESFTLLRTKIKDKKTAPFIDDIVVRPEHLPEFLPKLNAILDQYDIIYTIAGHVGNGNFHIIPLMNLEQENDRKIIPELMEKVYGLVFQYHGSTTGEHNDGLIRGSYLPKMFGGAVYELFLKTKHICDPHAIFNPRKKVNVDVSYALEHIRRT